jgi:arginyl-tRNA synthetase
MNFFKYIEHIIISKLEEMSADGTLPSGLVFSGVSIEPPRDPEHGDVATNAALVLGKSAGRRPRDIADALAGRLRTVPEFEQVEVAGPGFINLRLGAGFFQQRLADVLRAGTSYGDSDLGARRRVNVEYVSANPTGPLHVGHARGAVFGDALANLLAKVGYDVTREYYVNDAGAQVDVLARSTWLRYREALGEDIGAIPEGLYPGDYLVSVGRDLADREGGRLASVSEKEWLPVCRDAAINAMMLAIRDDLAALGIAHDRFTSERDLVAAGRVDAALERLSGRALIYEGVLEPPKGKVPDDWEPRPQTLFRSTGFGDDVDRPLRKSDGSWTYFATDVAYHLDKTERGFSTLIDVWGADHGGYVKRMKAAVAALSEGAVDLDIKLCQLVKLTRGGEPVRMSKRSGSFVTLREVVDEVGRDVVRFIMLTRRNDAPLDFDFVTVTEQSRENPVFYVQYAHARAASVRRNAAEILGSMPAPDRLAETDLSCLTHPEELALIRLLAGWPRVVETAASAHEPHRLAFYLQDVAAAFHQFWNRGKEDESLRFIVEGNETVTMARVALVTGVSTVLASGLAVVGVVPVEEMR